MFFNNSIKDYLKVILPNTNFNLILLIFNNQDQKFYPMSSDLTQQNNNEKDQITIHKPGTGNIKDQILTKEEIQLRRNDRMVFLYFIS